MCVCVCVCVCVCMCVCVCVCVCVGGWVGLRLELSPARATESTWSPTGGIREPAWDRLPGCVWVGLRPGLVPPKATGSNWWAKLETGSGVGVASILSISRIISSNRELVIASMDLPEFPDPRAHYVLALHAIMSLLKL